MLRITALRKFKVEFFHALRNGKTNEQAADIAITRVKKDVLEHLQEDFKDEISRMENWGDILEVLVEYQILLRDLPVDRTKIPPKSILQLQAEQEAYINSLPDKSQTTPPPGA